MEYRRTCWNFVQKMKGYVDAHNQVLRTLVQLAQASGQVNLGDVVETATADGKLQLSTIVRGGGHWYEQDARQLIEDTIEQEGGWSMVAHHLECEMVAVRAICDDYDPDMTDLDFVGLLERNGVQRWVLLATGPAACLGTCCMAVEKGTE